LGQSAVQAGFGNPEVLGHLRNRGIRGSGNPDHVLAELLRKLLRHPRHPSSGDTRLHRSDVTYPCSRPDRRLLSHCYRERRRATKSLTAGGTHRLMT
jgi:hypothetical protein